MIRNNRLWNALAPEDIRYVGHPDLGERGDVVKDGYLGITFIPVRYAVLFLMGREVSEVSRDPATQATQSTQAIPVPHIPPGTDRGRVSVHLIEEPPPPSRRIEHHRRASERRRRADIPALRASEGI